MKKFLSVLLLVVSLVFLASCDLFKTTPKKEELDLTVSQMQELVSDVKFEEVADDIIVLKGDLDFRLGVLYNSDNLEEAAEGQATIKGELEVYANLKTFESSYVYVKFSLDLDLDVDPLDFDQNIDLEELEEFMQFKKMKLEGKAYLIQGVLYVDVSFTQAGKTVTFKQYDELFTIEEFDLAKQMLKQSLQEFDMNEILGEIPEDFEIESEEVTVTAYKLGKSHLIEAKTDGKLGDLLEDLFLLMGEAEGVDITLLEDNSFDNKVTLQFSDKIEKLGAHSLTDVKVKFDIEEDNQLLELAVYLKADLTLDLQGKMPKNLPKASSFTDFVEGIDLSELFGETEEIGLLLNWLR